MPKKILGITWLHGRFHAVDHSAGSNVAGWDAPSPVNTGAEFAAALGQAVRETGFRGQNVVVVIDHRNLLFHVQDAPPAKGKVLKKLLDRLVTQNQFFDEPASHAALELPQGKALHRHLLALLPQSLVNSITDACANHGLRLEALWPAAAVVASRLRKLPAAPAEVVILATPFGDSMNLLLGRPDGKLLFSRTVVLGVNLPVERAAQEINRTLHYAQQQFGALVNLLFVSGAEAFAALKNTPIRGGLRTLEAPADATEDGLLALALRLSSRAPLNLVRHAGSRAVVLRALAASGLAAALAASVATTVYVEIQVHAREKNAQAAEERLNREAEAHATSDALNTEAHRLRTILAMVGSPNDPPVIELFARHLPSVIPPSIRVTDLKIEEGLVGWTLEIKGAARHDATDLITRLEKLEHEIEKGVFGVKITDSSYQKMFRGELETAMPTGLGTTSRDTETPFFITGVIE